MKKRLLFKSVKILVVCIITCFFIFCVFGCGLSVERASRNLTTYNMQLTLNTQNNTIAGSMQLDFRNNTESPLSELHFNLFANAFREDAKQEVVSLANFSKCFYNGKSFGGVEIKNVYEKPNGNLNFEVGGEDFNILVVNLKKPVEPQDSTRVCMDFSVTLPNANHRFGFGENTINLGNFFPILCVYENGSWQDMYYYYNGDPFYSEVANYNIDITYPADYILASTGNENQSSTEINSNVKTNTTGGAVVSATGAASYNKFKVATKSNNFGALEFNKASEKFSREEANEMTTNGSYFSEKNLFSATPTNLATNTKTSTLSAKAVRDFAIVFCKNFKVLSEKIGKTTVFYYSYSDKNAAESMSVCVAAMKTYNEIFGEYPYSELKVVEANFVHGGMEYPNIVLISNDLEDRQTYNYCIAHEIAHQWWYGVVGNNQTAHAWMDEGLTEYSTALFFEKNLQFGLNMETLVERANGSYDVFQTIYGNVLGKVDTAINRSLSDFETEPEYFYMVYVKGFLLFETLQNMLGEKLMFKCLKNYYTDFAFKTATPDDLIGSFEHTSRASLESYFNTYLNGKVIEFHTN